MNLAKVARFPLFIVLIVFFFAAYLPSYAQIKPKVLILQSQDQREDISPLVVDANLVVSRLESLPPSFKEFKKSKDWKRIQKEENPDYCFYYETGFRGWKLWEGSSDFVVWSGQNSEKLSQYWKREIFLKNLLRIRSEEALDVQIEVSQAVGLKETGGAKLGEDMFFEFVFRSATLPNIYVTMFLWERDGYITQLFPNRYDTNPLVKTNQEWRFPNPDTPKKYKMVASEPIGEDTILLITSQAPFPSLPEGSLNGIYLREKETNQATKGIKRELLDRKLNFKLNRYILEVNEK